ncbi:transcriptional regulator, LuxR family (plasmid) [Haloterrigena turkmenica DSM 5511]|uniref:Transcriptional regulator, LuxR family n=2 Tax=Haloterrigena turkmenica TaxID=62320 RepID=D2S200_HALTV|nr:transcriptional regulator, LuxR family [Haloterrigena turkmenica DSM 5511]
MNIRLVRNVHFRPMERPSEFQTYCRRENVKCQIHKLYSSSIQNETSEIDVSIPLTDRQYEVAQIATEMGYFDQEGTTTKEIAEELDITPSTLSTHLRTVQARIRADRRAERTRDIDQYFDGNSVEVRCVRLLSAALRVSRGEATNGTLTDRRCRRSTGNAIGSLVVRGEDIHRLRPKLEQSLETPAAVADDAPEFAVYISLSTVDRTGYVMAATRILQTKNLRPTRDSISLLQALVSSPYAAVQALQQLATEDESRELRPDELRYALGTLDPEQLLADLPPTVGRIVQTRLTAENRLSQCDLADRAGVSARTIRNYHNRLEAFDLIQVDETGYRLALSFQTTSERRDPVVPTGLEETQTLLDTAAAFLETLLPPERYGDPDDPLGSVLFWPPDPQRLLDHHRVGSWLRLAAALTVTGPPGNNRAVQMGPSLEQQALSQTIS